MCRYFLSLSLLLFSIVQGETQTFNKDRLDDFYDTFVCEQKDITSDVKLTAPCLGGPSPQPSGPPLPPGPPTPPTTPLSPKPIKGYMPVVISNQTVNVSDEKVMVSIEDGTNLYYLAAIDAEGRVGIRPFMASSATFSAAVPFTFPLTQLPKATTGSSDFMVYVPQSVNSGRFYFSINTPIYLLTASGSVTAPPYYSFNDPNYNTLFETVEFTIQKSFGAIGETNWKGIFNTTEADAFTLPIETGVYSFSPTDPSAITLYAPNFGSTPAGFSSSRQTIITNAMTSLTAGDLTGQAIWKDLAMPFYSDPYTPAGLQGYLRIISPLTSLATQRPSPTSGYTIPPRFPSDYLSNVLYGDVFVNKLFDFYNSLGGGNTFYIESPTIGGPVYSGTASGTSPNQVFTFENTALGYSMTINQSGVSAAALFGNTLKVNPGSNAPSADQIAIPLLFEIAFEVGMIPSNQFTLANPLSEVATSTLFTHIPPSGAAPQYYAGAYSGISGGPWYDLYSKAIHPQAILSLYAPAATSFAGNLCYSSPYDDALLIGGAVTAAQTIPKTKNPYERIVLHEIDTFIPTSFVFEDPTAYTVTFSFPSGSLSYRQGSSSAWISVGNGAVVPGLLSNQSTPLQIQYAQSGSPASEFTVYLKYQFMQPLNQYSTEENAIIMASSMTKTGPASFTLNVQ